VRKRQSTLTRKNLNSFDSFGFVLKEQEIVGVKQCFSPLNSKKFTLFIN